MSEFDRKLSRALGYVNEGRDDMLRDMLAKMGPDLEKNVKASFAKYAQQRSPAGRNLEYLATCIQKGFNLRDHRSRTLGLDKEGKYDAGRDPRLRGDPKEIPNKEAYARAREYVDSRLGGDASLLTQRDFDEAQNEAENSDAGRFG